jgi:hypothetical protein
MFGNELHTFLGLHWDESVQKSDIRHAVAHIPGCNIDEAATAATKKKLFAANHSQEITRPNLIKLVEVLLPIFHADRHPDKFLWWWFLSPRNTLQSHPPGLVLHHGGRPPDYNVMLFIVQATVFFFSPTVSQLHRHVPFTLRFPSHGHLLFPEV